MSSVRALKTPIAIAGIQLNGISVSVEMIKGRHFLGLPRCVKQRNEKLRIGKHLDVLQPEHLNVAIYRDALGRESKIDGHTRAHKWKTTGAPEMLFATVYTETSDAVNTVAEQIRLYDSYDSRAASKKAADEIQGAMNMHGIEFRTPWMAAGSFSSMLSAASKFIIRSPQGNGQASKEARVAFFHETLQLLDSISPRTDKMTIGFGAGVIMILHEYGAAALDVIRAYNDGTGSLEVNGQKNALARLQEFLKTERAAKNMSGAANNLAQAPRVYELLQVALRTNAVNSRVTPFNQSVYTASVR